MLICGGLTCTSVPIEGPRGTLGVDGLHGDVVRRVGQQVLQSGVVSVPWNHSLSTRTAESQRLSAGGPERNTEVRSGSTWAQCSQSLYERLMSPLISLAFCFCP